MEVDQTFRRRAFHSRFPPCWTPIYRPAPPPARCDLHGRR